MAGIPWLEACSTISDSGVIALVFEFVDPRDLVLRQQFGMLPSELLMQRYYWAARVVSQLSTILLQVIKEKLFNTSVQPPIRLNDDFCVLDGRLGVYREDCFARNPALIFRAFLWLQQRSDLQGMTARTLRAIWHARRRTTSS